MTRRRPALAGLARILRHPPSQSPAASTRRRADQHPAQSHRQENDNREPQMANANDPRAEILRSRDFIGWAVTSSNGANVGTVSDILIDRKGQVRYLAIDPGFFKKAY